MNDWGGEKITLFTINYAPYDTLSHGILLHRLHPLLSRVMITIVPLYP